MASDLQAAVPARYEIGRKLGEGGLGLVYAAFDRHMRREVAIKFMNVESADLDRSRAKFHREARALSMLRHPNVVAVYDYSGVEAARPFLVCERVEGEDLAHLVARRGPLDVKLCAAIGHEVLLALAEAHAHDLVHRDVTPPNVMIEQSGRVVLMDFGIARKATPLVDPTGTFMGLATQLIGTPLFMSPEHIRDPERLAPASDLFSFGSLLVFAASGRNLFQGEDLIDIVANIVAGEHDPLERVLPPAARQLAAIIASCTQVELARRAHDAREVAVKLSAIYGESDPRQLIARGLADDAPMPVSPLSTSTIEVAAPVVGRVRRPPGWRIALASTLVLGAAVGVLWQRPRPAAAPVSFVSAPAATESPPPASDPALSLPLPIAAPSAEAPSHGELHVYVQPYGVVYVDGERLGMTPDVERLRLTAGTHHLRIEHPLFEPIYRTLAVSAGKKQALRLQFSKKRTDEQR